MRGFDTWRNPLVCDRIHQSAPESAPMHRSNGKREGRDSICRSVLYSPANERIGEAAAFQWTLHSRCRECRVHLLHQCALMGSKSTSMLGFTLSLFVLTLSEFIYEYGENFLMNKYLCRKLKKLQFLANSFQHQM